MISWRARRQLIAVLFVLFIVGGFAVLGGKNLLPAPSCTDGRQNQGERGADCGGPCASCELRNPQKVTVFWARAVPVASDTYDVAAEIENPNDALASGSLSYTFTLYDTFGPVAVRSGTTFLYPRERLRLIESNLRTVREPVRVEFEIKSIAWDLHRIDPPRIVVQEKEYTVITDQGKKQGAVVVNLFNSTSFDIRETEVRFVLLDREKNLLGVNRILVEDFAAGSQRMIRSIWPEEIKGAISTIIVDPRVNVFDAETIQSPLR